MNLKQILMKKEPYCGGDAYYINCNSTCCYDDDDDDDDVS